MILVLAALARLALPSEHFKKHSKNQNTQQERGPKPELPSPYLSEDVCCQIVDVYQCVVGEVSCTSLQRVAACCSVLHMHSLLLQA